VLLCSQISTTQTMKKFVDTALSRFGKIDILVNNAGMASLKITIPIRGVEEMKIAQLIPDLNEPLTENERNMTWYTNIKEGYN
jgi:NAD(P)-dependent dehydrogenase (short-subunit alcohol dehydrogenase family)